MSVKSDLFLPGEFYHIFHQGNSGESIFKSDENFQFFLTKYSHYIFPVAETYSYCLMPNHFHLAIRLREEKELNAFFSRRSLELHPKQLPPQLKTRDEYSQS
ncbi:MAG: hypothetical protein LH473_07520, partial [Chitinophagales bacterium]|nr:hypothetical protein [Chitinophagales bacterium]